MEEGHLSKQIFFGELVKGARHAGSPNKKYKDHLKRGLLFCNIPKQFEILTENQTQGRNAVNNGIFNFGERLKEKREIQHQRRHEQGKSGTAA